MLRGFKFDFPIFHNPDYTRCDPGLYFSPYPVSKAECDPGKLTTGKFTTSNFSVKFTMAILDPKFSLPEGRIFLKGTDVQPALTMPVG